MIRRLRTGAVLCLVAALLLAACQTTARSAGQGPASRVHAAIGPTSGADNLRVGIDLALGAHMLLLARTTDAALGVRTTEFSSFGTALHADDSTVAGALVRGNDPQTRDSVANALTELDQEALEDATAVYTRNTTGQQQAANAMKTTYVPAMRSALALATHAGDATLTSGLTQQVTDTQALISAQGAGNWAAAYQALAAAYTHQVAFGTSLAQAMARVAPRTYPGHPLAGAATLRDTVESQLQLQAYLLGMAESAGAGGRTGEQQAAAAACAASTTAIKDAIDPADADLAMGVSTALTQAQAAAAALAEATAKHDAAGAGTQQQTLTQTFPGGYATIAHGQLGVGEKQATGQGYAWGQALAIQAAAEGAQKGTPQEAAAAATAGARLGGQLSVAVATRFGATFPTN